MSDKTEQKPVTFAFGRFNPPHLGHGGLVNAVTSHAWKQHGDHVIFASHSHDPQKNPLSHREKVKFMTKLFPHANVDKSSTIKNPLDAIEHLQKQGYKHITMVVGKDREQIFTNLLAKYHKLHPEIEHLKVHAPEELARDPDVSASKMREHAKNKNFSQFRKGVPNPSYAKDLYQAVRKGMKLENFQPHFKALFIVGAPGSGKDFLVKSLLEETRLLEFPLEKLVNAISLQENIQELNRYPSLIVNGNADNYEKVMISKQVLEVMGYDTAMVYVYTTDEESKTRNDERIARGSKTLSEEIRHEKYTASLQNLQHFRRVFERFDLFDNSNDFVSVDHIKKQEILGWLEELGLSIGYFYESLAISQNAQIWRIEEGKRLLKEGGNVTAHGHSAEPIQVTEKNRQHVQSDIHHTLSAIHDSFHKEHGVNLFGKNAKALHNNTAYSGSTKHLMSKNIEHKEFAHYKPSVGDVDVQIPKEHAEKLANHLAIGRHFGNYHVVGLKKHGTETTALMKHYTGKIHQFDFEHVNYKNDEPTKGEQFAHSSDWEDTKAGIKGAHHKILLNAAGGDKYKFSITHGLSSREKEGQGEQDPEKISKRLFGDSADHSKIHSFHGIAELIKKHIPPEHHEEIYNKFKSSMESKKKIDSSKAYAHLRKTLGIEKTIHESGSGAPGGTVSDKSGGDTDKYEPMAQNYPKSKKPKKYTKSDGKGIANRYKKGEKSAMSPPNFFDQRMGMVPSGGVGITVSHFIPDGEVIQEKSFDRLRRNLAAVVSNIDEE